MTLTQPGKKKPTPTAQPCRPGSLSQSTAVRTRHGCPSVAVAAGRQDSRSCPLDVDARRHPRQPWGLPGKMEKHASLIYSFTHLVEVPGAAQTELEVIDVIIE